MRAYGEGSEEALRARELLKDWAGEGLISQAQYESMEKETVCDLRRTNIFLRLVLFLFTVLIAGATAGLFFKVFLWDPTDREIGIFLLVFAAICYGATEFVVSRFRLYRHGIEEALAVCSAGLLCGGIGLVKEGRAEFAVCTAGAIVSLWIWHRFGLPYAFPGAMIFATWLPDSWTSSHAARHVLVAAMYAAGLSAVAAVRARHRLTYLNDTYSLAEAFLWLGIYLAINLQISAANVGGDWWNGIRDTSEFSRPFYWTTWVLTWCLPPAVLVRGIRLKDRWVIAAGAIAAILTFVTNKPYLGWPRHTWDPMLLGALLIAVALFLSRWLAGGAGGVRHGFTARRLSGKDKQWMSVAAAGIGIMSPPSITVGPQPEKREFGFGGGDAGGGGASSDF